MPQPKNRQTNQWITDREETLLDSPGMKFVQRDCHSSEDQRTHRFYLLESRDWANIIPITEDGKVVLVKQFRVGINRDTLEIPGGTVDPEDQDVASGAIREMIEETGYHPLPHARCEYLGKMKPNPAMISNECHAFAVGPVKRLSEQKLDEGEMIETTEVDLLELPQLLQSGEIDHALIMAACFLLMTRNPGWKETMTRPLKPFVHGSPALSQPQAE